ncbi:MAG TPA: hypothetical protein VK589_16585 [Chryseolinea sp.]|nr:hypothetical protein [Chryseolinea sp.]
MTDIDLASYLYWEYSVAVLLFTEICRLLLKNVPKRLVQLIVVQEPKWLSLIVATVLALLDWLIFSKGRIFHFWQFTISYGVAVLGYDYAVKLIKDTFKGAFKKTDPIEPPK